MRKFMEGLGVVLIVEGGAGLLHEFTDRFRFAWLVVRRLPFLDGYEIYANVFLIVLGLAVLFITDARG